jgi:nicotinamidase-related amidase
MPFISALPYEYELPESTNVALIVIDMQRDFMEPGGFGDSLGNDVNRLQAIVPTLKQLLQGCRALGLPIFHTVEGHNPDLSDCPLSKRRRGRGKLTIGDEGSMGRILVLGEPGNGIIPELVPLPGEILLPKPGKGAFYGTNLGSMLKERNITHLLITGVTTEVCVQTTMREANDRGYECLMVEDATESYFPEFKQATLEMVRAQGGIVGWTATTEQVLTGLQSWKQATVGVVKN